MMALGCNKLHILKIKNYNFNCLSLYGRAQCLLLPMGSVLTARDASFKIPVDEIAPDHNEIIVKFLTTEKEFRKQYEMKRLLRISGIKQVKIFDHFDWHFNPKIRKEDVINFKESPWIEQAFNLILIGDTGLGKGHIAASLCYEAIIRDIPLSL